MNKTKIVFILNPVSGVFSSRRYQIERMVTHALLDGTCKGDIRYSRYAGHTTELVADAVKDGADMVVVAGGDGSINEAARALVHTNTALGIIPAGSGNGLSRHLHIPFNMHEALTIITRGHIKNMDVLKINERFVFSIAGIGLDALVAEKYKNSGQRGILSYIQCAATVYFHYTPENLHLKTPDMEFHESCLFLAFANANQFGYNFKVAPDADLFDGLMNVVICRPIPLIETPFSLVKVWEGKANEMLYISSLKTNHIVVTREHAGVINLDGDPCDMPPVLDVSVLPKALHVVV
ncbi:MAG: diacylglycerol kinase family lipid kinase [Bacteroidales bacterium]|jgi:YegS/Rv2252/BmrU family lipid kinase|nr:diacylglycerol kinase family lipid kinase [Bacteroidales bacterium]